MALRGALAHRKTRKLARLLNIPPCFALGIMESIWHVTATQAPTGAIGRLSDEDIADQLGYPDDGAGALVRAMVDAGFLDEVPGLNRLYVHDWHQHSDNTLDAQLYRRGERYANGKEPRGVKLDKHEKAALHEKFYKQPAATLPFAGGPEVAQAAQSGPLAPESPAMTGTDGGTVMDQPEVAASNLVVFPVAAPPGAGRRLPEPEPVPVPAPEPTIPLPPASRGTRREMRDEVDRAKRTAEGQHLVTAASHVVQQCRFSGTAAQRLQVTLYFALEAECVKSRASPAEYAMPTAELMVANFWEWSRAGPFLKHRWNPQRFFAEGHWANPDGWPWDQQRLDNANRASVGTYR